MKIRLNKVIKEFGVGFQTVADFLKKKGFAISDDLNQRIDEEQYEALKQAFATDKELRGKAEEMVQNRQMEKRLAQAREAKLRESEVIVAKVPEDMRPQIVTKGHIDLPAATSPEPKATISEAVPTPTLPEAKESHEVSTPSPEVEAPRPQKEPAAVPAATAPESIEAPAEPKPQAAPAPPPEALPQGGPAPIQEKKEAAPVAKGAPLAPQKPSTPAPRPSAEERANAIGEEKEGVFRLHAQPEVAKPKIVGHIELSSINPSTRPSKDHAKESRHKAKGQPNDRSAQGGRPQGSAAASAQGGQNPGRKKRTRIGNERIDVNNAANQPASSPKDSGNRRGGDNRNFNKGKNNSFSGTNSAGSSLGSSSRRPSISNQPVSDEDVARQVKETLARLTSKQKAGKASSKYRREKRDQVHARLEEERREAKAESKTLKLTEFVTANELAQMMDLPVTKVISTCMSIGIMVSINQRMDAETIDLVAEEFGFKTEYVSAEVQEAIAEEVDSPEDLEPRAPIVTVMGHVDHGKTSLLDYIRKSNVIAGEAGGITQHIGAYNVTLENGRHITFLDTPGHEAFTAMRARGAQVTDIAIIIIAADDDIMPQTKEAISHAVAANVPIVFAINKVDKPHANPEKIKEGLAAMNFLVEDWGGKYQSQDISAKKGTGVSELLEKVLLEADMLELKANPNRKATGTIIESSLDKGRGYVATVLISNGTLNQGDVVLAGTNYGRIKALFNERSQRVKKVGPAMAATLLGFNGAPQAGDQFHVMDTEQEAREITSRREQLQREQDLRTREVLTLEKLGKRLKMGSYHELNLIVKADVDGSVEALADSFIKLSTEQIVVKVIFKGVGQISENDVTLAAASEAIIVGFQVRPSLQARKLAERDGVEIRQYSVIYDAIEDVKLSMEGMLEPVIKEEVTANLEVRQVFHISKVGYVAGAYVVDGKVKRSDKARLIREGIVVFTGEINALKRFKDDVKEVNTNFECGISLTNCNDIREGDLIETFQEVEVKQKL